MKKISIKRLDGSERAHQKFETDVEMNATIDGSIENNYWGKKAGSYPMSSLSVAELLTEISRVVVDEFGNLLSDPLITIPAQYTIEIEDITYQVEALKAKHDRVKALKVKNDLTKEEIEEAVKLLLEKY